MPKLDLTQDLTHASLKDLRATQELLQKAHDYTEGMGFDAQHYEPNPVHGGACCYIGTVRLNARVRGFPDLGGDVGAGNGPELRLALQSLDAVAVAKLPRHGEYAGYSAESVADNYGECDDGRYAEALAFVTNDKGLGPRGQKNRALAIYRQALTDVHKLIEQREAKP